MDIRLILEALHDYVDETVFSDGELRHVTFNARAWSLPDLYFAVVIRVSDVLWDEYSISTSFITE